MDDAERAGAALAANIRRERHSDPQVVTYSRGPYRRLRPQVKAVRAAGVRPRHYLKARASVSHESLHSRAVGGITYVSGGLDWREGAAV